MTESWTIKRTLDWCCEYLERHDDEAPRLSAEWLMCDAVSLERIQLYMQFDRELTMAERDTLRASLKRRAAGEPLQYIIGEAAFRHIVVKTAPGVLIPRPETEVLVSEVLDELGKRDLIVRNPAQISVDAAELAAAKAAFAEAMGVVDVESSDASVEEAQEEVAPRFARILEIGTGTGCIALSLAKEAGAHVTATDVSPQALACARDNCEALGLSSFVDIVEADCAVGVEGPFDALVSNPPYIPSAELEELPREVTDFEPTLALDGGADGLAFFDRLLAEALPLVAPRGFIAFELHETCLDEAASRARAAGLEDVRVVDDLAGRHRILIASVPTHR